MLTQSLFENASINLFVNYGIQIIKVLLMLWISQVCVDCLTLKSFSCKVRSAVQNLIIEQFIQILTQKMNNFSKV